MPKLLPDAVYNPSLFAHNRDEINSPSIQELRYDLIDAATDTFLPLYENFEDCLNHYKIRSFYEFYMSSNGGRSEAALHSFLHPTVWPDAVPLDGILDPFSPDMAKRNLIVWGLGRTIGSYTTFNSRLSKAYPRGGLKLAHRLSLFRAAAQRDPRRFRPEDFTWAAQKPFIRGCLEGSNRSKQGRALEERAREALRELLKMGWRMTVHDKEIEVVGLDNLKHRVDILLENDEHVLIIHMKSSQLLAHGYSAIFVRETTATTSAVLAALAEKRKVVSMTIFCGEGWNGERIPGISNPIMSPGIVGMAKEDQTNWFQHQFSSHPLLQPFNPKGLILPSKHRFIQDAPKSPLSFVQGSMLEL
jgi:hypothetical protein